MKYAFLVLLLSLSLPAYTQDKGPFIGFNVGQTKAALNENFDGESETFGAAGIGLSVGYQFVFPLLVQLGATGSENFSLFGADDRYNLQHVDLLLGYKAKWKALIFMPKIGYANWELNAKEGQFLNPGVEATSKQSGNDFLWGASLGFSMGSHCELSLSYKDIKTKFGGYRLSHVELIFKF